MKNDKEYILSNGQINELNKTVGNLINDGKIVSKEDDLKGTNQHITINFNPDDIDVDKIIDAIIKRLNRQ